VTDSTAADLLTAWGVPGIGEVRPGDDLAAVLGDALAADAAARPATALADGDVVVVTSKIVSKAEGRVVRAADREAAITAETVRVVATREHAAGVTRIVENRLGLVMAAAGVDASNTEDGTVLLLPLDPDATARALQVSVAALADEIAAAAELVKGKATGRPVAVVRGMAHAVTAEDGPGARVLVRVGPDDMFAEGSAEAYARGWKDATGAHPGG
jgi:coenzyme F420-0:L-glutamate ligase/coenzyme F420-1:gamma-L-glutamate ligase